MVGQDLYLSIIQPFLKELILFLPLFVLAIFVFVICYLISIGLGRLITEVLKKLKFNRLFAKDGWQKALEKAEIKVDPSSFVGAVFKWIFIIVSLLLTVDILKLTQFGDLLRGVLNYIPNVIIAVLIFVVGVVIADVIEKMVRATVEKMKISYAGLAASIVRWTIWVFLVFMILDQLLPKSDLVQILYKGIVYGIVAAVAGAVALSFGLGGKDAASQSIEAMRRKFREK